MNAPKRLLTDLADVGQAMKPCAKCRRPLDASQFHRREASTDGLQSVCKGCQHQYAANHKARKREISTACRWRNIEHRREYEKQWNRSWREANPDASVAQTQRYKMRNPGKESAHREVEKALTSGVLVKPKYCEWCERNRKLDATHGDYTKPLDVTWLCRPCHAKRDGRTSAA